jgi:hypothetical protein
VPVLVLEVPVLEPTVVEALVQELPMVEAMAVVVLEAKRSVRETSSEEATAVLPALAEQTVF